MKRRRAGWVAVLLMLATVSLGPGAVVYAATVRGAPITVGALDDAGATVHEQQRFGIGRIAAMVVGGLGLLGAVGGRIGIGLTAAGVGFGSAFVPAGISSAFDAAPAADGFLVPLSQGFAAMQGFVGDRLVHDPVFLVCLAGVVTVHVLRTHGTTPVPA